MCFEISYSAILEISVYFVLQRFFGALKHRNLLNSLLTGHLVFALNICFKRFRNVYLGDTEQIYVVQVASVVKVL